MTLVFRKGVSGGVTEHRTARGFSRWAGVLAVAGVCGCASAPPPPAAPAAAAVEVRAVPPRIGLALGGGGARGFAHIGVLRVLEQEKIPVAAVAGTSVGSLIGALYADTGRVLDAEFHAVAITAEDLFDYRALAFFSGGFVRGERLRRFLDSHLTNRTIETMRIPFAAVATDLRTGSRMAFRQGPVAPAVHASCAIPGVFVPVELGGVSLVDGGVVNPIPVDVARELGAEVVIAVAIPSAVPPAAPRNPIQVAYHAVSLMAAEIGRLRSREADVLIEPAVGDVAYDDFSQKKRLIEAGEAAARQALPAIWQAIAAGTREVPVVTGAPVSLTR